MKKEYDRVKLHATVINTNFKLKGEEDKQNIKKSNFDARKVFQVSDTLVFQRSPQWHPHINA